MRARYKTVGKKVNKENSNGKFRINIRGFTSIRIQREIRWLRLRPLPTEGNLNLMAPVRLLHFHWFLKFGGLGTPFLQLNSSS